MTELNTIVYFPRKVSLQNTAGSAGQSLETGAGKTGRIPQKISPRNTAVLERTWLRNERT